MVYNYTITYPQHWIKSVTIASSECTSIKTRRLAVLSVFIADHKAENSV